MRHRVFIGGSSEELPAARAIRDNLSRRGHTVKLWNQGVFSIGKTAFESLLAALEQFDAAVFVFAPSDLVSIRGSEFDAVRDNVVFELGLFTGRLGRDRTFWAVPKGQTRLRIASDLLGVLPAEYEEPDDGDWPSALASACDRIHDELMRSAQARGMSTPLLALDTMTGCVDHLNRVMHRVTAAMLSGAGRTDQVRLLPEGTGLRVRCGANSELTVRFGRIEQCGGEGFGSVVALPANEYFDDECITDPRSALGSFVLHHFRDRLSDIKRVVAEARIARKPTLVQRDVGKYQESFGVGTSLWLERPLETPLSVILSAVTRERVDEGPKAEPSYVFAAVRSISRIMNNKRLTDLYIPLLGSGHGDMDKPVALYCLALALACTPDIKQATIVLLPPAKAGDIDADMARRILAGVLEASS
jgi:predicted nucleotide-binding protein with TIR-like domain